MPRLDRIEALADPDEQAKAAAVVEAEARAEAARAARIKSAAMAAQDPAHKPGSPGRATGSQ